MPLSDGLVVVQGAYASPGEVVGQILQAEAALPAVAALPAAASYPPPPYEGEAGRGALGGALVVQRPANGGGMLPPSGRCFVASVSSEGGHLTVSRGYSHEAGGHYGELWTLSRVGKRPEWAGSSPFAGSWCAAPRPHLPISLLRPHLRQDSWPRPPPATLPPPTIHTPSFTHP